MKNLSHLQDKSSLEVALTMASLLQLKKYVFEIDPMGSPRLNKGSSSPKSSHYKSYVKYKKFKSSMSILKKLLRVKQFKRFGVIFYMPIPNPNRSTIRPETKKEYLDRIDKDHEFKPDIDNLEKAVLDSLMADDAKVSLCYFKAKVWTSHKTGRIELYL